MLDRNKISNLTEASITKRFDWNFEVDYFSISHVELDARMFEKWMASFSRTEPTSQRCPTSVFQNISTFAKRSIYV